MYYLVVGRVDVIYRVASLCIWIQRIQTGLKSAGSWIQFEIWVSWIRSREISDFIRKNVDFLRHIFQISRLSFIRQLKKLCFLTKDLYFYQ